MTKLHCKWSKGNNSNNIQSKVMVLVHIVLYNCMKFHLNSFNGCQLTEQSRSSIANDQREITPKMSKAQLWFLCMTHCLIVLYKCMKFQPNSFNSVQLTERTRNCIYLCYKGKNLQKYTCKSYGSCA